jgi:hypothetical protein
MGDGAVQPTVNPEFCTKKGQSVTDLGVEMGREDLSTL